MATVIERLDKFAEDDSWPDISDDILSVRDALPALLKLAQAAERYRQCQEYCPVRKRGEPCGDCLHAWVEFKAALEPLFREDPS